MNAKYDMFQDLTEAELSGLTEEERVLWLDRPTKTEISYARSCMIFRVCMLVAATIYYMYKYGDYGETSVLLMMLFSYEAAYYILRKEKVERNYDEAKRRYYEKVERISRRRKHSSTRG